MTTYTATEAAAYVGWDVSTIRRYARTGRIPARRWLGRILIDEDGIAALLAAKQERERFCRNGHDRSDPASTWTHPNRQGRRCRQCLAEANRRWYRRRYGTGAPLFLAERHPDVFAHLADDTRGLSTNERLAAALRFWECYERAS